MKNKKQKMLGNLELLGDVHLKKKKNRECHGNLLPLGDGDFKDKKTRELRATPPLRAMYGVANFIFLKKKLMERGQKKGGKESLSSKLLPLHALQALGSLLPSPNSGKSSLLQAPKAVETQSLQS